MTQITTDLTKVLSPPAAPASSAPDGGRFAEQLATAAVEQDRGPATSESRAPAQQDTPPPESDTQATVTEEGESREHPEDSNNQEATDPPVEAPPTTPVTALPAEDTVEISAEVVTLQAAAAQQGQDPAEEEQDAETPSGGAREEAVQQPASESATLELPMDAPQAEAESPAGDDLRPGSPSLQDQQTLPNSADATGTAELGAQSIASSDQAQHVAEATPVSRSTGEQIVQSTESGPDENAEPRSLSEGAQQHGEETDQRGQDAHPRGENREQAPPVRQAAQPVATEVAERVTDDALPVEPAETAGKNPTDSKAETPRLDAPRALDRIAAGRIGANRTDEAPSQSPADRVDAARFVGRVSKAFESAHQRGDVVRLRLSPPELGAMQIKLAMSGEGAMTASVETETAAARSVLLDNLPALRERLAEMEIRVEKFDVDVRQEGGGNQNDWEPGGEDRDRRAEDAAAERAPRQGEQEDQPADTEPTPPSAIGGDQINLVI